MDYNVMLVEVFPTLLMSVRRVVVSRRCVMCDRISSLSTFIPLRTTRMVSYARRRAFYQSFVKMQVKNIGLQLTETSVGPRNL